eukprot:scaffold10402_cov96-Isochrysis_galbana.AAC.1
MFSCWAAARRENRPGASAACCRAKSASASEPIQRGEIGREGAAGLDERGLARGHLPFGGGVRLVAGEEVDVPREE